MFGGKKITLILTCLLFATGSFAQQYSTYDLRFPSIRWKLASTPRNAPDSSGNLLFPEAEYVNYLWYSFNKANLAWYNIDPLFLRDNSATPGHIVNTPQQKNHYAREIPETEVYPGSQCPGYQTNILTFDLAYYPDERGQYNYEHSLGGSMFSAGLDSSGRLKEPGSRWGGIMRSLDNTDWEAENIRHIVFWILDPFLYDTTSNGGSLYIQIGYISEDVIHDSRMTSEGCLDCNMLNPDTSVWGISLKPALCNPYEFSPEVDERQCQDIGLDGLNDEDEIVFFNRYLDSLQTFLSPDFLLQFMEDPSGDNYHYYRGDDYDAEQVSILGRFKKYNKLQGNSPVSSSGQTITQGYGSAPDNEDLNGDHVLNETEAYFQYGIELKPNMDEGQNFIVEKHQPVVTGLNPGDPLPVWYQFKIPIEDFDAKVGSIPDFRSIRFMRIFLTGFEEPVVLRFAQLGLERSDTIEPVLNTNVRIYPNPNNGKFTLELNDANVTGIYIYNALGQLLPPLDYSLNQCFSRHLDLDLGYQRGVYFIRIQMGDEFTTGKVVVR